MVLFPAPEGPLAFLQLLELLAKKVEVDRIRVIEVVVSLFLFSQVAEILVI